MRTHTYTHMCAHKRPHTYIATICHSPMTVCVHVDALAGHLLQQHLDVSQAMVAHLSEGEKHISTVAWNARL